MLRQVGTTRYRREWQWIQMILGLIVIVFASMGVQLIQTPTIGYDAAATIAKTAHKHGTTLREEALKTGLVTAADYDRIVRPEDMTRPG